MQYLTSLTKQLIYPTNIHIIDGRGHLNLHIMIMYQL